MLKIVSTVLVATAFLAACSTADLTTTTADISAGIQSACKDVMNLVPIAQTAAKGGAAATVNSLALYGTAACATGTAVAALVQNSATIQWLGNLQGQLSAVATPAVVVPAAS